MRAVSKAFHRAVACPVALSTRQIPIEPPQLSGTVLSTGEAILHKRVLHS